MGFSYTIQYKSGIENLVVDALSHISGTELFLMNISLINYDLHDKIQQIYGDDFNIQNIITSLQQGQHKTSFTLTAGLLKKKGKIVIGPNEDLKKALYGYILPLKVVILVEM